MNEQLKPVTIVEVWNHGGSGEFRIASGIENLPNGTQLYVIPDNYVVVSKEYLSQLENIEEALEHLVNVCNNSGMAVVDEVMKAEAELERLYKLRQTNI